MAGPISPNRFLLRPSTFLPPLMFFPPTLLYALYPCLQMDHLLSLLKSLAEKYGAQVEIQIPPHAHHN